MEIKKSKEEIFTATVSSEAMNDIDKYSEQRLLLNVKDSENKLFRDHLWVLSFESGLFKDMNEGSKYQPIVKFSGTVESYTKKNSTRKQKTIKNIKYLGVIGYENIEEIK